MMIFY